MAQLFANNANSYLAGPISPTDKSLTLQTGDGALFPNPSFPDFFLLTLEYDGTFEIVMVTARNGDTLTIVRGQEGTTPADFPTFASADLRITAGALSRLVSEVAHYRGIWDVSTNTLPASPLDGDMWVLSGTGTVGGTTYANGVFILWDGISWQVPQSNFDPATKLDVGGTAANSNELGGIPDTGYWKKTDFDITSYLLSTSQAADSAELGGAPPSSYVTQAQKASTNDYAAGSSDSVWSTPNGLTFFLAQFGIGKGSYLGSISNANTLSFSGIGTTAANCTGLPTGLATTQGHCLLSKIYDANTQIEALITSSQDSFYYRRKLNGSWVGWVRVWDSSNFNPANYVVGDFVGAIAFFACTTPPTGWLVRNGAAVSRTTYAALFARISTMYGAGDGSTTFNLPDDRNLFERGYGSLPVGTYQGYKDINHSHGPGSYSIYIPSNSGGLAGGTGVHIFPDSFAVTGNSSASGSFGEIFPNNRSYLPCIKY